MSIRILHQEIDYDKSAGAWGRYERTSLSILDIRLIQYHDTQDDAITAALPQVLRDWMDVTPADPGRLARAACIALDRTAIAPNGDGETRVYSQNGNGAYMVADGRCTCPDWRPHRKCKHVLAIDARAQLDTVTITCTLNQIVTGGRTQNIMIHDSKLILVQEGTAQPRKPRNPQAHTAYRWLTENNYILQAKYWLDDYTGSASRRERRIFVPMGEAR